MSADCSPYISAQTTSIQNPILSVYWPFSRAMSSACVPCSTMAEPIAVEVPSRLPSTTMRSALRTVERRCAITIVVSAWPPTALVVRLSIAACGVCGIARLIAPNPK